MKVSTGSSAHWRGHKGSCDRPPGREFPHSSGPTATVCTNTDVQSGRPRSHTQAHAHTHALPCAHKHTQSHAHTNAAVIAQMLRIVKTLIAGWKRLIGHYDGLARKRVVERSHLRWCWQNNCSLFHIGCWKSVSSHDWIDGTNTRR